MTPGRPHEGAFANGWTGIKNQADISQQAQPPGIDHIQILGPSVSIGNALEFAEMLDIFNLNPKILASRSFQKPPQK